MALKTLHITNAYHPTSGGISTFYRAMLRAADAAQRTMVLVVPGEDYGTESVGSYGRIRYVRAKPAPFFDRRYRMMFPGKYLGPGTDLIRILKEESPDVVEICDKYTLQYLGGMLQYGLAFGVKRPTVIGLSCERMDDNFAAYVGLGGFGRFLSRLYMKEFYFAMFDHHIANSEYTGRELYPGQRRHRTWREIRIAPMGVDYDRFAAVRRDEAHREQLLRRLGASRDAKLLLYAGRLSPEKNVRLVPAMMGELVRNQFPASLVIAGDGPLAAELASECQRAAPGRTLFLGHLRDPNELARLLGSADLFIHPNPKEPFGIGPLEAMAAGLGVVAPNAGGLLSYANGENAWLVDPTPTAFAEAAVSAICDDALRQRKLEAARHTACEFRWERVTQIFFDLYDELHALRLKGRVKRRRLTEKPHERHHTGR